MIFIFFIIAIYFLILDKNNKYPSTRRIFNLLFLIIILLYQLRLSTLQEELINRTILMFIIIIIAFNMGAKFIDIFKKQRNITEFNEEISYNSKILNFLHIMFIILFIIECIYSKGFPLLSLILYKNSNYLNFGIPSLHGLLNGLAICLCVLFMLKKSKRRYIYYLFSILTISRQVIISILVEYFVIKIILKTNKNEKINTKKAILYLIIFVCLFAIVGNFRSGANTMQTIFMPRYNIPIPNSIMWIYSYATFSIANLNNLVSISNGAVNHGASLLNVFLPTIILKRINLPMANIYYFVKSNFNVSTAFASVYLDFGLTGVGVFSFLVGIISEYFYLSINTKKTYKSYFYYAVTFHNVIFIFFNNMFLYLPIIVQYVFIYIIFSNNKKIGEIK